jgi:hypothetical protein
MTNRALARNMALKEPDMKNPPVTIGGNGATPDAAALKELKLNNRGIPYQYSRLIREILRLPPSLRFGGQALGMTAF